MRTQSLVWFLFALIVLLTAPASAQAPQYAQQEAVIAGEQANAVPQEEALPEGQAGAPNEQGPGPTDEQTSRPHPRVDSTPYAPQIRAAATRHGVSPELVAAVIQVESSFNPQAVSRKGARGLMQLMPATAAFLGVRNVWDPMENIEGGVRHLRALLDRFANSLPLALAAYNAGEQAVKLYRGIPPFQETEAYVARILNLLGRSHTEPEPEAAVEPETPQSMYRATEVDGTLIYSNSPNSARQRSESPIERLRRLSTAGPDQ